MSQKNEIWSYDSIQIDWQRSIFIYQKTRLELICTGNFLQRILICLPFEVEIQVTEHVYIVFIKEKLEKILAINTITK